MSWDSFIYFSIAAVILWTAGALTAFKGEKKTVPSLLTALGLAVFFAFILGLWVSLERPPLRTMGETRLWYSLFLPLAGLLTYRRWGYRWILSFTTVLSAVFIIINITKPVSYTHLDVYKRQGTDTPILAPRPRKRVTSR